jgi:hypothetical protein
VRKFAFASLRSESEAEDTAAMTFQRALSAIVEHRSSGEAVLKDCLVLAITAATFGTR